MKEHEQVVALTEVSNGLAVQRAPETVLNEAMMAAKALTDVLEKKKKKVVLNGEQYLEFEDWQTLGRFYGVTAKVTDTHYVEYGDIKGFSARAVAIANGMEISAAEADCLTDEEHWRARPKYKTVYVLKDGTETDDENPPKNLLVWEQTAGGKSYPKKKRIHIGDDPVPMFQLKSMAQTRACAKALRNVLAWVVVLAGYKATPAEELDGIAEVIETTNEIKKLEPSDSKFKYPELEILEKDMLKIMSPDELKEWVKANTAFKDFKGFESLAKVSYKGDAKKAVEILMGKGQAEISRRLAELSMKNEEYVEEAF